MSMTGMSAKAYAQNYLAVVNQAGEVWARSLNLTSVGSGFKLAGPSIFGGPAQFALPGFFTGIDVVTPGGAVWTHSITITNGTGTIGSGVNIGSLFGGPDAEFVLKDDSIGAYYVVNTRGQVWIHNLSNGVVGGGTLLNGPSLFGGPNQKFVLFDPGYRILVINTLGEVWAHDLVCPPPNQGFGCVPTGVGIGYKLGGPRLFGGSGSNDKYALVANQFILIVNSAGQVWAHRFSHSTISAGYQLQGPSLFGGDNTSFVVGFTFEPIE
jgi:hypothetical protein